MGMKRLFFYILLLVGIIGSTAVVLFVGGFLPKIYSNTTGMDIISNFVNGIIKGTYNFGTTTADFFIYGIVIFLLMNAALVLSVLLSWLLSGFRLFKIRRFYSISIWFLISSVVISAFWVWRQIDTTQSVAFKDFLGYQIVPLASALVLCLLGLIFSVSDRQQ